MIEHQEFGDAKQEILDGAEQLFISRGACCNHPA